MLLDPRHFLSLGFGAGLAPVAPGTWGTLVAVPLYLAIAQLALPWYLAIVGVGFCCGIWLCGHTGKALGVHDHGGIVWDEIVGFWVTMIAVPVGWQWILLGFVLFRLFDIVKPWPVKIADRRVPGGLGVMFDDLLAGLYALACMHIALQIMVG
ncbi:MAG: phosphatidylglycerophosphatase A [Gammaproteobacteria bacterium]|jgi:phosphatidylglycerophosphatase A